VSSPPTGLVGRTLRRVSTGMALCGSVGAYVQLEAARLRGGRRPQALRLAGKAAGPVWMRNGSTDYPTLVSCFIQGYHRPLRPLPAAPVIVDVGANVGYTLIDFRRLYPAARLIGVEMDAANHAMATLNVRELDVELLHAALWHEDGEVSYDADADADAFSARPAAGGTDGRRQVTVPALGVATLLERLAIARVDYLKIDIEGAEREVFAATDLGWLHQVDQLSVELHGSLAAETLIARLAAHGMQARKDDRHWDTVVAWRAGGTAAAG
jgi:FkbM family methyltransferase